MSQGIITDTTPLQSHYIPASFQYRAQALEQLRAVLNSPAKTGPFAFHLRGATGTGKTHLLHFLLNQESSSKLTSYIPCHRLNTEYKALKQIYRDVTNDSPQDGYHTAALQRTIENRTTEVKPIIVLDDLEFLLENDGDDLLYFLSRLETDLTIIPVSSPAIDLQDRLESRTYSSLQPAQITLDLYTADERYQILAARARNALTEHSLQRAALSTLASATTHLGKALHWMRTAAATTDTAVTESHLIETRGQAAISYAEQTLDAFTDHHLVLYRALLDQQQASEGRLRSGTVYDAYRDRCRRTGLDELSHRRISDFLTHLEYLDLIAVDYHYGGQKGKTREIELRNPF